MNIDKTLSPNEDTLGKRTPEEIAIVDTSFKEWMDQPRPFLQSIKDLIRDAFHVGFHRGKMSERYPDNPD